MKALKMKEWVDGTSFKHMIQIGVPFEALKELSRSKPLDRCLQCNADIALNNPANRLDCCDCTICDKCMRSECATQANRAVSKTEGHRGKNDRCDDLFDNFELKCLKCKAKVSKPLMLRLFDTGPGFFNIVRLFTLVARRVGKLELCCTLCQKCVTKEQAIGAGCRHSYLCPNHTEYHEGVYANREEKKCECWHCMMKAEKKDKN